jgi:hypothetical protein
MNRFVRCSQSPARRAGFLPAVLLVLWATAFLPAATGAMADDGSFRQLPPALVQPASDFNALFTRFDGGWTGGDGTYSVPLPDQRTVWLFGDSFLGMVFPDRSRPRASALINNCMVVQRGDGLETLFGGTPDAPRALMSPPAGSGFYWPADATVEGQRLQVFYQKFHRTGPGPWQWRWIGTDIVAFSLPALKPMSIQPRTPPNGVMYGAAILEDGDTVYIFGTEDRRPSPGVHLARARAGRLSQPWRYYTGSGWSAEPRDSTRLMAGVANQFSVLKIGNRYFLITMDSRRPFHRDIVAYAADAPWGPWQPALKLYTAPEAGGSVVAYNALAHPQYTAAGRLLLSYNLNPVDDFDALFTNVDLYRPIFIRVDTAGFSLR